MTTDPEDPAGAPADAPSDTPDLPTEETDARDEPATEIAPVAPEPETEPETETETEPAAEPEPERVSSFDWASEEPSRSTGCLKGFAACGCGVILLGFVGLCWLVYAGIKAGADEAHFWRALGWSPSDTAESFEAEKEREDDDDEREDVDVDVDAGEDEDAGEDAGEASDDPRWRSTHPRRKLPEPSTQAEVEEAEGEEAEGEEADAEEADAEAPRQ